jgi:signal transduction histidine kinase
MNPLIRYRLLTIVVLGVLTSAVSVFALVQLLTTSTTSRIERAREVMSAEADGLAHAPARIASGHASMLVGLRAGIIAAGDAPPAGLPDRFVASVHETAAKARSTGQRVVVEASASESPEEGTSLVAAVPVVEPTLAGLPSDAVVFVTYTVRPLPSLQTWQRIVEALAGLTVLLVLTAVYSGLIAHRGAAELRKALEALASNLHVEIPRSGMRELDAIADGIENLAANLAESREKEDKLAAELAQNERLAALGRVAAGVAHEVRNPLASIKLRLDLALTGQAALPPAAEKAITHAASEIDRLDRLVADLLVMTGRAAAQKTKTDVGALAGARVDALSPWAKERDVKLAFTGVFAVVDVDVDGATRAIDNLLRNAVEASPTGGTVRVGMKRGDGRVLVEIEDEGPGVLDNRATELFEPFFTTKASGTGLGLALSRAIARAHGGDVIYSRHDGHTCFALSLSTERRAA